jgi:sigma-54 dependent transcriptional regulator, flagellar regulatory protein
MTVATIKRNIENPIEELIVGHSSAIVALRQMVHRVARCDASIMIAGPSGSGKEVVARAIHEASDRSSKPFVALNCGAIPADLIETELFGHERGAFTGANCRRIGRFEEANGGTLFLDEIGDMRFDMQVKLLRVLEDGIISRVGSSGSLPVDVRIISATHRNIELAIEENRFREDLYFRLGVVPMLVPDLASRTEDIPLLIAHFQGKGTRGAKARFDASGIERLKHHAWPGNVRELRNLVERASVLFAGETISASIAERLLGSKPTALVPLPVPQPESDAGANRAISVSAPDPLLALPSDDMPIDLKAMLETMELERIQFALDLANGVISDAARLLTLKRTTLIEKMRKYRVERTC